VKLTPREIDRRAATIRLLAMDVDGVLTDGKIIIRDSGEEIKEWNVKDRIGFFVMKREGFLLAWITGRKSKQVEARAGEIKVDVLRQHADHKGKALEEAAAKLKVPLAQTLFIGDDWVDLPALARAGLSICPADACAEVRRACHWTLSSRGGEGAFREAADRVLRAQGLMQRVLQSFAEPLRRPNP
jgi:3-deoxy-D-manno-octulosonate 8-phosphate phosphatase (KDO 8-P phosphatase)